MTREEIEKKIAEMEAGIEELKEESKKAEDINPDVFIPKDGEEYWSISSDGDIFQVYSNDTAIDKDRLAIGSVFRTQEEAVFETERLKVIHELKMYAESRDAKWDGENAHYYIKYDWHLNDIHVDWGWWFKHDNIYFSSKDRVREAIKAVGEERIKKYYLCVEEGNI